MYVINEVFKKLSDSLVIVFIDDILVYSKSEEEREKHIRKVLMTLRAYWLNAKFFNE